MDDAVEKDVEETAGSVESGQWIRVLGHGVDSLDVGMFVRWDHRWPRLATELERGKRKAYGHDAIPFGDGRCLIWPTGKKPSYRWHLQFPGFHLFLSKQAQPCRATPNVYASLNSELLWREGLRAAVERVCREVMSLGGTTIAVKVSRCDPCVDVLIPGGLTLEFLERHRVPAHRKENPHKQAGVLQTYYNGVQGGDIQLRLYDKSAETLADGSKLWFFDLWGLPECPDVWRFEFQLRRPALKQFGVHSLDDLLAMLPGVWSYLTENWFSLRFPDNANATRREIHPLWEMIQGCAERFGSLVPVERRKVCDQAGVDWYVKRFAGSVVSYAACRSVFELDEALRLLGQDLKRCFLHRDFAGEVRIKAIRRGKEAA